MREHRHLVSQMAAYDEQRLELFGGRDRVAEIRSERIRRRVAKVDLPQAMIDVRRPRAARQARGQVLGFSSRSGE